MPTIKKIKSIQFKLINQSEGMDALKIAGLLHAKSLSDEDKNLLKDKISVFNETYHHPFDVTLIEIWRWFYYTSPDREKIYEINDIYRTYVDCNLRVNNEPMKLGIFAGQNFMERQYLGDEWVFNGYVYEVKGFYSDDEIRLLILDDFDKERRYFEKLKIKFDETKESKSENERPRIPENVRIEVWRRDGGKCARCGSREKLEYDHIFPISRGGSNTARNIELLCEKHNRSKSNNVV